MRSFFSWEEEGDQEQHLSLCGEEGDQEQHLHGTRSHGHGETNLKMDWTVLRPIKAKLHHPQASPSSTEVGLKSNLDLGFIKHTDEGCLIYLISIYRPLS